MKNTVLVAIIAFGLNVGGDLAPAAAQSPAAAYDVPLLRLAQVLGSVHYLRNLCGESSNQWRDKMNALLVVEKPEPTRRAQLVASFNRGYRNFGSVYTSCTPQALVAVEQYMAEGKSIATEINSRYAN
ncbi:MAG: TIGR02301 family protein [Ahrensia sp.]|nr:TIGR02301 family protein [Ahrensia sp.]